MTISAMGLSARSATIRPPRKWKSAYKKKKKRVIIGGAWSVAAFIKVRDIIRQTAIDPLKENSKKQTSGLRSTR